MNAPLPPEILRRTELRRQDDLPVVGEGVQRYVWKSQWGVMVIEVAEDKVFVNGELVEPFRRS